jgi:methylated-DNA-protein-cysteine methyltransferase-like protein
MPSAKFRRVSGLVEGKYVDRIARMHRIWETICDIPRGAVASYGQIAEIAGLPRGARQVGYALRHLPEGHEVPWHRVLQVSGKIAFAKDSRAYKEQSKRLMMEDVAVIAGRVDMQKYRWQPDLDELLWKPSAAWDEV